MSGFILDLTTGDGSRVHGVVRSRVLWSSPWSKAKKRVANMVLLGNSRKRNFRHVKLGAADLDESLPAIPGGGDGWCGMD